LLCINHNLKKSNRSSFYKNPYNNYKDKGLAWQVYGKAIYGMEVSENEGGSAEIKNLENELTSWNLK